MKRKDILDILFYSVIIATIIGTASYIVNDNAKYKACKEYGKAQYKFTEYNGTCQMYNGMTGEWAIVESYRE